MAGNFPELWQARVEQTVSTNTQAPWLDGIPELAGEMSIVGEGSVTEKCIIHLAATDFEPDVLINNTTYPLEVQEYDDETLQFTLDKYQPKVVTLSDDQAMGASYPKIDAATTGITNAILKKKYGKAAHSLAPNGHTEKTPVLVTTGETVNGRKRLTYDDLVTFRRALVGEDGDTTGLRIVLCPDHETDILLDRKNFGDKLVNYNEGDPAPKIAGLEIYTYGNNPYYTVATKTKKAYGSVPGAGDVRGSFAFKIEACGKKTGVTKQYYVPAAMNPKTQANELGYRHYFVAVPKRAQFIGAIISDLVPAP